MRKPGQGLTQLPTDQLKTLLKRLHRGELQCPIDAQSIASAGFQHRHAELMDALRGLDEPGVRAVLVCVLAERMHLMGTRE